MAKDCRKKTHQVDGLARTTKAKAKASLAWQRPGQARQRRKGKGKLGMGKGKNKNRVKGFHEMEEHDDTQDTQTSQGYTERTDTS